MFYLYIDASMLFRFKISTRLALITLFCLGITSSPAVYAEKDTAKKGEALYLQNCAICHGNEGHGGMGVPLSLKTFLDSASTDYLKKTIRLGRPDRIMPSFYWMSEDEIDAIITYIAQWRTSPAPVWSDTPVKGNALSGKSIFTQHCASCHGSEGEGGKGTGMRFSRPRDLPITAPALNNQGLLNSAPDQMLRYVIQHGREGTPMPSAASIGLNDNNIDDLVSYIRSFQQPHIQKQSIYHDEPASLIVDSPYDFDETVENVKRAIVGSNFVHIRDQALTEGFDVKPLPQSRQTIIYFCNFSFLNDALKIDPRVGMFLPCRITITENKGAVQMMTINPKHLSQLFNNNALDESCNEMHRVYTSILEDASL